MFMSAILVGALFIIIGVVAYTLFNSKPTPPPTVDPLVYDRVWYSDVAQTAKFLYDRPDRHYHNWAHIQEGLAFIERYPSLFTRTDVLAWLFHDIVYVPGATDNEKKSAELMNIFVNNNPKWLIAEDERINAMEVIERTVDHVHRGCVVCNLDLMRLAVDSDKFAEHGADLFAEFSQTGVVDSIEQFTAGQIKFFEGMLDRTMIYTHPAFAQFEVAARENMMRAVVHYRANPGVLLSDALYESNKES